MSFTFENKRISADIITGSLFQIPRMQDWYIGVTFRYHATAWNGAVPIVSKYQGINVPLTEEDVLAWVNYCHQELDSRKNTIWQRTQSSYWENKKAFATQAVFDALNGEDILTKWLCRRCGPAPKSNPQSGARIRDLRKWGYSIATKVLSCETCGCKTHFDLLVRLPRQAADNEKRSSLNESLKKRIKEVLPLKDVCFDEPHPDSQLVIDHKFPSSRWVVGETINAVTMTQDEIRHKFQLLTQQTNSQKERYCKRCVSLGIRGDFFGIKWFHSGDEQWRGSSKADENGCVGCCWYDLEEWKMKFNEHLASL